jgi:hypothetical protein
MKIFNLPYFSVVSFVLIHFCSIVYGQDTFKPDTIIFRNEAKLEVIVREILQHDVKYNKTSDPNGPKITLNKSEIAQIRFGDGTISVLEEKAEPYFEYKSQRTTKSVTPFQEGQKFYNLPIQTVGDWQTEQLQTNYQFYLKKANTYKKMGKAGAIGGAALAGIGIGIMAGTDHPSTYTGFNQFLGGYVLFLAGVGAGIPLTIIGFTKKKSYTKKALLVREELRKRNEPFGFKVNPIINPANRLSGVSLRVTF